jgi:hypothetical protein
METFWYSIQGFRKTNKIHREKQMALEVNKGKFDPN